MSDNEYLTKLLAKQGRRFCKLQAQRTDYNGHGWQSRWAWTAKHFNYAAYVFKHGYWPGNLSYEKCFERALLDFASNC